MLVDNIKFLIYNVDLLQRVLFTLELVYGGLGLALIILYFWAPRLRSFASVLTCSRLPITVVLVLFALVLLVQADSNGWAFTVIIYTAALCFTLLSYSRAAVKINQDTILSIESLDNGKSFEKYLSRSFVKAGIPVFIKTTHLKFLLFVLLSESVCDLNQGCAYVIKAMIHYGDLALTLAGLALIIIPFVVIDIVLRLFSTKSVFPQGYFQE